MLLIANPLLRIRFSYKIDKEEFIIDSTELIEEGIDSQQQGVSGLIKSYIKDKLEQLILCRSEKSLLC